MKIGDRVEVIEGCNEYYSVGDTGKIVDHDKIDNSFDVKFNPSDTVDRAFGGKWWCHRDDIKVIGE